MDWGFYGRHVELDQLRTILQRNRWFFVKLSGRRRIGKTTLIQRALQDTHRRVLYMQVPDSGPAGVLSAVRDAFETFGIDATHFPLPTTLSEFATTIATLAEQGFVVVLDEFQYFHRAALSEFTSHLQREVDRLSATASSVPGGLFVLGSLHAELTALLDDRDAPLYNRVTDTIEVGHLDVASIMEILRAHADPDPERLLLLWNLFEGVPKFYRDCFEQDALACSAPDLLRRMFFLSSAPLRNEAENWFLHELRGRYDVVLKFIARNPGCSNGDLDAHVRQVSPESAEQTAGYVKILTERYELIERRLPIFAKKKERKGRYHVRDNFLRSWLSALAPFVSAVNFQPTEVLVQRANARLKEAEGTGLERLVATLYEERSRKALPGFALSHRVDGYWDAQGTEIDLVAVDDTSQRIRFGTCKRDEEKLEASLTTTDGHIDRFMAQMPRYRAYAVEKVAIAPRITADRAERIRARGWLTEDLRTLTSDL
ncbi:ATP-binding protein [Corallococcus interemptor]|uniref:ATP-binding protein n=1 Tax=Corallococcus interemptor TaxID=2316720 RepID=UPI003CFF5B18